MNLSSVAFIDSCLIMNEFCEYGWLSVLFQFSLQIVDKNICSESFFSSFLTVFERLFEGF